MYFEGFFYGILLVVFLNGFYFFNYINNIIFNNDYILSFYLCLGAGIFEELLFRLVLINLFIFIFKYILKDINYIVLLSMIVSSLLFSSFHYIGSLADNFTLYSFTIRFIAGIYLCILYYFRGIGISMFSHFVYDFLLITTPLL